MINPKVLPSKIILIELKSKIYIFIQPFKILLGLSKNILEANSTLTQVSFLLTFQLRNTVKVVPTSSTNNSLAKISGQEYREVLELNIISFVLLGNLF